MKRVSFERLSQAGVLASLVLSGLIAAAVVPCEAQGFGRSASGHWVGTWGASPSDPLPGATSPGYSNQTVRQVAHISIGGQFVRLRLSNMLNARAVQIGSVHIALSAGNGAIVPGSDQAVLFSGRGATTIPHGAVVISDPVSLAVPAEADLAVSIYFPQATGPISEHSTGQQNAYVASGDASGTVSLDGATAILSRPLLSDLEVYGARQERAVVTFGDSITDGVNSTVNANLRWPDDLATLLVDRFGNRVGVVNAGINGNRLLSEGTSPNALSRFDRDVLSKAGVKYVTVLLGINDIGHAPDTPVTTDQIIAALQQVAERAHDKGLLAYVATLTPVGNSKYSSDSTEAMRQAVNAWIRSSGAFDAVLDFDRATLDPSNPTQLRPEYDSGDHLHPNDLGYAAMAASINLSLFGPEVLQALGARE